MPRSYSASSEYWTARVVGHSAGYPVNEICAKFGPPGTGADFQNSLGKGGREFPGPWGTSTSRNITSSKTKGIGAWSDDEIKRAITTGTSRDGGKLKPPMGYHYYATVTPDDLNAIVAYLRTVPAVE